MHYPKPLAIITMLFLCQLFLLEYSFALSNPSWSYSGILGYKGEIRKTASGAEDGVVIFPDGSECSQWDFYYGSCGQKWTYCEQQGFLLLDNARTKTGIGEPSCLLPDARECFDYHLITKKCQFQDAAAYDRQRNSLINGFYPVLRSGNTAGEKEVLLVQNHKYISDSSSKPRGYIIVGQNPKFPLTSITDAKIDQSEAGDWQFTFAFPEQTVEAKVATAFVFEGEVVHIFKDTIRPQDGRISLDCISLQICKRFYYAVID